MKCFNKKPFPLFSFSAQIYRDTAQCVSWKQWYHYPLQQRQSGFQCSLRTTERKTIPMAATKPQWIIVWVVYLCDRKLIKHWRQLNKLHNMLSVWKASTHLKFVIWFSSRTRNRSLMSSKRSFSSTITVPRPSGLFQKIIIF